MTATSKREPVDCGCGAVLKNSDAWSVAQHNATRKHQAWLAAAGITEQTPTRQPGETAAHFLARVETNTAFIATDEGQALLEEAQAEDKAARKAALKAETAAIESSDTTSQPAEKQAATSAPRAAARPSKGNTPLVLGETPIEVDGIKRLPILGKDGQPLPRYQTDNWVWKCGKCGKRVRAAKCPDDGTKAPANYRADDRIVK